MGVCWGVPTKEQDRGLTPGGQGLTHTRSCPLFHCTPFPPSAAWSHPSTLEAEARETKFEPSLGNLGTGPDYFSKHSTAEELEVPEAPGDTAMQEGPLPPGWLGGSCPLPCRWCTWGVHLAWPAGAKLPGAPGAHRAGSPRCLAAGWGRDKLPGCPASVSLP